MPSIRLLKVLFIVGCGLVNSAAFATDQSGWLEKLDRQHQRIGRGQHVHASGTVELVEVEQGTITIWHTELGSPDRSIWMPAMRMTFHATNRRMLKYLKPGDHVTFEAVRLRNAVMVTAIRKAN